MDKIKYTNISKNVRKNLLNITYKASSSHIGSSMSLVEILVYLYSEKLNKDSFDMNISERNSLIISKGHAAAVVYSILYEFDYISKKDLDNYSQNGSFMTGHVNYKVNGVEFSTGSLGHGLSVALGISICAKRENRSSRCYVILSDGELNEGSIWEGIMFSSHHKLDNITIIIDNNKIQSFGFSKDVINMESLENKFESFGLDVFRINGHNFYELDNALSENKKNGKPKIIIADTIKGKGVTFMENKLEWHYRSLSKELYEKAIYEIEN
ncbi:MAG: transketolase [Cyanobacteriota bacterium]